MSKFPKCAIDAEGSHLEITWRTGSINTTSQVPAVWLRDNSPHAIDAVSFGRTLLMADLELDVRIDQEKFPSHDI